MLRLAATTRFPLFDKLETDVQNLQPLYGVDSVDGNGREEEDGSEGLPRSIDVSDRAEGGMGRDSVLGSSQPAASSPALQETAVR